MRYLTTLLFLLILLSTTARAQNTDWSQRLSTALENQQALLPQEKIYAQTDRTIYRPGEVVWLAAYLRGNDLSSLRAASQVLHLELLNPSGKAIQTQTISAKDGAYSGDFQLGPALPGGEYTIRAYTNYQGNFGDKYIFTKEIQVQKNSAPKLLLKLEMEREAYGPGDTVEAFFSARDLQDQPLANVKLDVELRVGGQAQQNFVIQTNAYGAAEIGTALPDDLATTDVQLSIRLQHAGQSEQISRPVPVVLENISLRFLPEGGEWVAGLPCRMAFAAKNEYDEPVDVAGTIYDARERVVMTFESLHDGLGSITLPADVRPPLRARLTEPVAGKRVYPLPDPIQGNWQLAVDYQSGDELQLHAQARSEEELQLVIRSAGQLHDCQVWLIRKGEQSLTVDVSGMPMGVTQFTVFDQQLRPVWERLVFLHPNQQLQVSLTTDKEQYEYREQVKLDMEVTDQRGQGVAGNFSLAVIDDQIHSYADDKQPNILAQFLLSSELHGKIHEPNFYFDPTEDDRLAALDLLLLTHGWRRFHWQEILQRERKDWEAMRQYPAEELQLYAYASLDGQYLGNAELKVLGSDKKTVVTDYNGGFRLMGKEASQNGEKLELKYKGLRVEAAITQLSTAPLASYFNPAGADFVATNTLVQVELEEALEDEILEEAVLTSDDIRSLPTRNINALAATTTGLNNVDEGVQLDEVVVTGYNVMNRKSLSSSSIGLVEAENEFERDFDLFVDMEMKDRIPKLQVVQMANRQQLSPTRVFAFPDYSQRNVRENQPLDKRKTLFWASNLRTDQNGKASATFYTSDEMTTFRATLEGIGNNNVLAHQQATFSVAPPLAIQLKAPAFALTGDSLLLPIVITNNTQRSMSVPLTAQLTGQGLSWITALPASIELPAGGYETLTASILVTGQDGKAGLSLQAGDPKWAVAEAADLTLHRSGFPHEASTSGQSMTASYDLTIKQPISGTIEASLRIFPDLMGELLSGLDAMLQQPNGCFEQTSSTNYPNIMVLRYLQERGELDEKTRTRAFQFLQFGYDRLSGYEAPGGGFSLWGRAPANAVLTAFGMLQFNDLSSVWPKVDPELIPRTYDWLVKEYEQNQQPTTIDGAYILYALSEVGDYRSPGSLVKLNETARASGIPYLLAIAARLNVQYGQPDLAEEQVAQLLAIFQKNKFAMARQSPYFSHGIGNGLATELISWTILAALEAGQNKTDLLPLLENLMTRRQGVGRFGATQPTVMALQAITAYEQANSRPKTSGKLLVSINQSTVDTLEYSPSNRGVLLLDKLGQYLKAGGNNIGIRFADTDEPLPYALEINWQSPDAKQTTNAPLTLSTELSTNELALNGNLRYQVQLRNERAEEGYAPMIILSTPAGLQWQSWQLKEMKDRGEIDYYEMHEPYLVLYFASIDGSATKTLDFDLTATIPGSYNAPAASAYLYYEDEAKSWVPGTSVTIRE